MTNLSHVVQDERTARMVLSMIVDPDDAVTGRLLGELGTLELFRLAERDDAVPSLSTVVAQVWRSQFQRSDTRTLEQNVVEAERAGIGALVPGDKEWPSALDDLGDRERGQLGGRVVDVFDLQSGHGHGVDDLLRGRVGFEVVFQPGERELH